MRGGVECTVASVNNQVNYKGIIHTVKTYGVATSGDAGSSRICLPDSNTPPQIDMSPSSAAKCLTFGDGRALVSVSATISLVGQ
jgi:hypothetical protein